MTGGSPGNLERMIVYGTLEYHSSLHELLGQETIGGGWRKVEWQKPSVLEFVGLEEKKV